MPKFYQEFQPEFELYCAICGSDLSTSTNTLDKNRGEFEVKCPNCIREYEIEKDKYDELVESLRDQLDAVREELVAEKDKTWLILNSQDEIYSDFIKKRLEKE